MTTSKKPRYTSSLDRPSAMAGNEGKIWGTGLAPDPSFAPVHQDGPQHPDTAQRHLRKHPSLRSAEANRTEDRSTGTTGRGQHPLHTVQ